jgi:hypothetical protein
LIAKGTIWSPGHGDIAFTVPLFDQLRHRICRPCGVRVDALRRRPHDARTVTTTGGP